MKLTELVTLIAVFVTAGWFSTVATQIIKRPSWPSWLREVLAIAVALLVGLAAAWLNGSVLKITLLWGHLTAADMLAFGAVVYAAASTWYHHYLSGIAWMESLGRL